MNSGPIILSSLFSVKVVSQWRFFSTSRGHAEYPDDSGDVAYHFPRPSQFEPDPSLNFDLGGLLLVGCFASFDTSTSHARSYYIINLHQRLQRQCHKSKETKYVIDAALRVFSLVEDSLLYWTPEHFPMI